MFGYIIGVVLFATLYLIGMKIMEFIDPPRRVLPLNSYREETNYCEINVGGVDCECLKATCISYSYHYNGDLDILEFESRHIRYELENPIETVRLDGKIIVRELGKPEIECCTLDDRRTLISCNTIRSKKIFQYRKSWKNKRRRNNKY